jgi:hypothetical protein
MPRTIINDFLQRLRCEVLINFMDSFIYRLITIENRAGSLDLLYGSEDWTAALESGLSVENKRDSCWKILNYSLVEVITNPPT